MPEDGASTKYLNRHQDHEVWSTLIFPLEKPPRQHISLWREVLSLLAPRGRVQNWVGQFVFRGHKIWERQYHKDSNRLFHLKGILMDIFTPSAIPLYANRPNFWTRSRIEVPREELGDICLVKLVALVVYSVLSNSASPPIPISPADCWHAIKVWGNSWIWDNLSMRGEVSWLTEWIADNSLVAVTNGSYMKEVYPNINLAGFCL
jgi:hypothetical protein